MKNMRKSSNWIWKIIFSQFFGDEHEKYLSCHHLVDLVTGQPTHPEVDQYLKFHLFSPVETYNNFVRKKKSN